MLFWLAHKLYETCFVNFTNFTFHIRRNCQDEEHNTTLMKFAWLKRSACTQCCIDKLTITKNGDGVRFCLQGFSCRKEAKIATPIWLWRREVLVQEVQPVFRCRSHVIICCAVRSSNRSIPFSEKLLSVLYPCLTSVNQD